MPSKTLICFNCREIKTVIWVAYSHYNRTPSKICPKCRNDMREVSSSYKIPKKRDNKGWRKLQKDIEDWDKRDDYFLRVKKMRSPSLYR